MKNQAVECPLCFKSFLYHNIEMHVQNCNGSKEDKLGNQSEKQVFKRKHGDQKQQSHGVKKISPWKVSNEINEKEKSITFTEKTAIKSSINAHSVVTTCTNKMDSNLNSSSSSLSDILTFSKPLYDIARPTTLIDYVGQIEVVGKDTILYKLLEDNVVPSMILWGPPGCGKSTLAHIIANNIKQHNDNAKDKIYFTKLFATDSGKADLQSAIKTAANKQRMFKCKTVLFIDEIHRFNKLQQDSLLPSIENGTIVLIGATTENPSFALNSALLSRCRVIVLNKLEASHVKSLLLKTISSFLPQVKLISSVSADELCVDDKQQKLFIAEASIEMLANLCDGDARIALNGLQTALQTVQTSNANQKIVDQEIIKECLQRTHYLYDRTGDQHYDIISALHKSIRGGDDNAALYWLTRMMMGGEDPRYIARRLVRMASEDIGLADPVALTQAVSCYHACLYVGMPECDTSLAQCVVYLARAPKSVEVYKALAKAKQCVKGNVGPLPAVPLHLRNAPTNLMKDLGYGRDYKYTPEDASKQTFLPDSLSNINFFS